MDLPSLRPHRVAVQQGLGAAPKPVQSKEEASFLRFYNVRLHQEGMEPSVYLDLLQLWLPDNLARRERQPLTQILYGQRILFPSENVASRCRHA